MDGPGFTITPLPSETAARQAAQGGAPEELNRLGITLKLGGREDEAAQWFRKAAEAGNTDGMANLAMYLMARGRNREAAEWFRRAGGPLGEALAQQLASEPDTPPGR
ncbi:tetratricopeptide repeat protein [Micromonospora craniellae]|uniref:tetratricopeptide repeat protein n=1 Tax=Micromonospora craniellae TaxID=2294034 RepID=UPI0018F1CF3D|nr:tetratricopeptide repeat protein [Micromonospora craniellae]